MKNVTKMFGVSMICLTLAACGNFKGATGSSGGIGPQGPAGVAGQNGSNGSNCSVTTLAVGSTPAPNGGSLITCSDGTSSVVLNGSQGLQGQTGASGQNGSAGTPGTVITPVQFCKGVTPTYPSTFPESGLCINNVMWGVYSANSGFLAELPPGTYSSDGINASCTFTIGANCAVSQ